MPSLGSLIRALPNDDYQKDWRHAERIFRDNSYALSPKRPFLYHVVFRLAGGRLPSSQNKELSLLVKNVALPSFTMEVDTKNRYNRKTIIQKSINYSPVTLSFHDDASNVVRDMWEAYYTYYYTDGSYKQDNLHINKPYEPLMTKARWGFDQIRPGTRDPFFKHIEIFSFDQKRFSSMKLMNPMLVDFKHGQHDYSEQGGFLEHSTTINYEAVTYGAGVINSNSVDGFAEFDHYDTTSSPLGIAGGGTNSVFGPGGFLNSADSIFGDVIDGNPIGAIFKSINLYDNIRDANVNKVVRDEGRQILKNTARGSVGRNLVRSISAPFSNLW